jgi:hypothetical protein
MKLDIPQKESKPLIEVPAGYCFLFQQGKCHRGKACRWKHDTPNDITSTKQTTVDPLVHSSGAVTKVTVTKKNDGIWGLSKVKVTMEKEVAPSKPAQLKARRNDAKKKTQTVATEGGGKGLSGKDETPKKAMKSGQRALSKILSKMKEKNGNNFLDTQHAGVYDKISADIPVKSAEVVVVPASEGVVPETNSRKTHLPTKSRKKVGMVCVQMFGSLGRFQ